MKPSVKINLLLTLFLFICALGALLLWPGGVRAAETTVGDFMLTTDGVQGTDYKYENKVLTILTSKPITIANKDKDKPTQDKIFVPSSVTANITLAGVNIDVSTTNDNQSAFSLEQGQAGQTSASVSLTLADKSTNTLKSAVGYAGLRAPSDTALTIDGSGSLNAAGGRDGAGIGGSYILNTDNPNASIMESSGNIIIDGGTVTATSGAGAGIGGGLMRNGGTTIINGGIVTATGCTGIGGGDKGSGGHVTINGGTVEAKGTSGAGIGGGTDGGTGGEITINGGSVTATGGTGGGAGIGGGSRGSGDHITITGGTVTANGGPGGAGIGGGSYGEGGTVTIDGGSIKATKGTTSGDKRAEDIGHGEGKTDSGTLTTTRDVQDNNDKILSPVPVVLTLEDQNRTANQAVTALDVDGYKGVQKTSNFGKQEYGIHDMQTDAEAKVYLYLPKTVAVENRPASLTPGSLHGYVGRFDANRAASLSEGLEGKIDLSQLGDGKNLYIWDDQYGVGADTDEAKENLVNYSGNYTLTGGNSENPIRNTVTVMDDYRSRKQNEAIKTITLNGLNINVNSEDYGCAFEIQSPASVNLMLTGQNKLESGKERAGLRVPSGASITIDTKTDGSLWAKGGSYGAGIGIDSGDGNKKAAGIINILGGTVEAQGGGCGAGIGSGEDGAGGTINISGGTVTATGGEDGAGIGGGRNGAIDAVNIIGGTVKAKGGSYGAGIGGNCQALANPMTVSISGGTVTAEGSAYGAGIGGSNEKMGGNTNISGGTVTATGGDYGAGIGGGYKGDGGTVIITGGSVKATRGTTSGDKPAEDIGHGEAASNSGTLKNRSGSTDKDNVYRVTVQLADVNAETPLYPADTPKPEKYGLTDVRTDSAGKLYFYLPADNLTDRGTWTTVSVRKANPDGDLATGDLWVENNHNNTLDAGKDAVDLAYSQSRLTYNGNVQKPILMWGSATVTPDSVFYKGNQQNDAWSIDNTNAAAGSGYQVVSQVKANNGYGQKIIGTTYNIEQATPTVTDLPTVSPLTYGQKLSDSKLTGGSATGVDGKNLPGTFAWADPDIKPSAPDSDKTEYTVIFTPKDTVNYNIADNLKVKIKVDKANPDYETPTGLTATYGQTLADVSLPQGFSWQDASSTPVGNVGSNRFKVTYTPADTDNYNTIKDIEVTIAVDAAESTMTLTAEPNKEIKVGEPVVLTVDVKGVKGEPLTGTVELLGKTLTLKDGQATAEYTPENTSPKEIIADYTPDSTNYNGAQASITLTAGKKIRELIDFEIADKTFGDDPFKLTPTGGSLQDGEAYSYASSDKTVAEVDVQGSVTLTGAGKAQVTVSVDESDAWNSAQTTKTLTVNKADITGITFESQELTANGKAQDIKISGDLPDGTSVKYTGNGNISPGVYEVTANIDGGQNYNNLVLTATMTIVNPYVPVKPTTPDEVADIIDQLPSAEDYDKMTDEEKEVVKDAVDTVVDGIINEMTPEEQAKIPEDKIEKLGDLYDKVYKVTIHKDTSAAEGLKTRVKEEDIRVYGAGMAAKSQGSDVRITITQDLPTGGETLAFSLRLFIDQNGSYIPVELKTPVVIKFPLPESVKAEGLEIHHMNPDGSLKEILIPTINGRELTFMTTSFSNFLFVETGKPTPTPVPTPGPSPTPGPTPTPTQKITNPLTGKTLTMETAMGTGAVLLSVIALIALGGWQKLKKRK